MGRVIGVELDQRGRRPLQHEGAVPDELDAARLRAGERRIVGIPVRERGDVAVAPRAFPGRDQSGDHGLIPRGRDHLLSTRLPVERGDADQPVAVRGEGTPGSGEGRGRDEVAAHGGDVEQREPAAVRVSGVSREVPEIQQVQGSGRWPGRKARSEGGPRAARDRGRPGWAGPGQSGAPRRIRRTFRSRGSRASRRTRAQAASPASPRRR